MKRKLLHLKSIKTLKSLQKNLQQKYDGIEKDIRKKEKELDKIWKDINKIEDLIIKKEE